MSGFLSRLVDRQLNTANNVSPQVRGKFEPGISSSIFQPGHHNFEKDEVNFDNISSIRNPKHELSKDDPEDKRNVQNKIVSVQPGLRMQPKNSVIISKGEIPYQEKENEENSNLDIAERLIPPGKKTNKVEPDQTNILNSIKKETLGENDTGISEKRSSLTFNEKTKEPENKLRGIKQIETIKNSADEKKALIIPSGKEGKQKNNHPLIKPVADRNPSTQAVPEKNKQLQHKTNQPAPKLVIGKIIVEVLPPVVPVPTKIITRVVQSTSTAKDSKTNKLSFGLGQL